MSQLATPVGPPVDPTKAFLSEIAWGAPHDQLDAYLSAWVASLEESDRYSFGDPPDDAIWVPRVLNAPAPPVVATVKVQSSPRETPVKPVRTTAGPRVILCPACGQKEFKRWPWGWDGHAAHACPGLSTTNSEERKAEFRRRFAGHFDR